MAVRSRGQAVLCCFRATSGKADVGFSLTLCCVLCCETVFGKDRCMRSVLTIQACRLALVVDQAVVLHVITLHVLWLRGSGPAIDALAPCDPSSCKATHPVASLAFDIGYGSDGGQTVRHTGQAHS